MIDAIGMTLDGYQATAHRTALPCCKLIAYPGLKLAGEAGEVAEKLGKLYRDHKLPADAQWRDIPPGKVDEIVKEMGDVLWYLSEIATQMGVHLSVVAAMNIDKLTSRNNRGAIRGDGDNR